MSEAAPREIGREEAELLLPWLATGRLAPDKRAALESYLARDPELRRQAGLIEEEAMAARAASEAAGHPRPGGLDRLMASLDRQEPVRTAAARLGGVWSGWLDALRERSLLAPLAAAAALLIAAETALLAGLLTASPPEGYRTASGPGEAGQAAGTRVLVGFAPSATMSEIDALLAEAGAVIVDGPRAGGLYVVRLSAERLTGDERDRRMALLRARPQAVRLVLPSEP